jgi:hypothetical protein
VFVKMNPNQRGAIAETAIALEAIRAGVEVYKPLSEHARADLVFGIGHDSSAFSASRQSGRALS